MMMMIVMCVIIGIQISVDASELQAGYVSSPGHAETSIHDSCTWSTVCMLC